MSDEDTNTKVAAAAADPRLPGIKSEVEPVTRAAAQHHTDADATHNFEWIDEVEWGKRKGEDGYDTDQSLAPRPRRSNKALLDEDHHEAERCDCLENFLYCSDESCLFFASREECAKRCGLNDQCQNQRLTRKQFAALEHFDAGLKGRGLRLSPQAERPAKKGDLLCEYTGRAIRESKLPKLFRRYQHDRRLYIMSLGDGVYIDARQKGGIARYINHSCRPNCKVELWTVKGIRRAAVVALDVIPPGDELTFDYQWERKRGRAPTVCHCGVPECRGTLEMSITSEEVELQRELEGLWEECDASSARDTLVNRTVRMYSTVNSTFFLGEVTGYDMQKGLHHIFYPHDKSEEWEDLTKETWMVLNETVDIDLYNIARKSCAKLTRASSSLIATSTPPPNGGVNANGGSSGGTKLKNYLYVQTHVKDKLAKTIDIVCRNCVVQIKTQNIMRPPVPPETDEEREMFAALDKSPDASVWRLTIKGERISEAYETLAERVKKFQEDTSLSTSNHAAPVAATKTVRAFDAAVSPSISDVHDVIFPRKIADAVKRKLATVRDACRNVTILAAPSESKTKLIGKLVIEGALLSDIEAAKEHLWTVLNALCQEANAPKKPNNMYRDLGFLGGALSNDQFQQLFTGDATRLSPAKKRRLNFDVSEDMDTSPFIQSFESTNHCSVWVQVQDDQGRINSSNRVVNETTPDALRKIYIGCKPSEVARLGAALQDRARDIARGVKYIDAGCDVVNWKMLSADKRFFDFVKRVTGASSIEVDPTTDHLRVDGKLAPFAGRMVDSKVREMTDVQRASFAHEIIRLQIECYRDARIRRHSWFFGRDWTLSEFDSTTNNNPPSLTSLLDRDTSCQCGMLIADIVAKLGLEPSVGGHAAVIVYRFVCAEPSTSTKVTVREGVLACIFLANKAQKVVKWKALDLVVQAGYEIFYKGAIFDKTSVEGKVLTEKVLSAESEILQATQYDVFWSDIKRIYVAATGATEKQRPIKEKEAPEEETEDNKGSSEETAAEAGEPEMVEEEEQANIPEHEKMSWESVKEALNVTFSGPVLGAGAELWLKYDVEYIFAAVAGFIGSKVNATELTKLRTYSRAMRLSPSKLSQTAQLLKSVAKYGVPTLSDTPSNKLFEQSGRLEQYLEPVLSMCTDMLRTENEQDLRTAVDVRHHMVGEQNRETSVFRGVSIETAKQSLLPRIDSVTAESLCRIYFSRGESEERCDVLLRGTWRAIGVAESLMRVIVPELPGLTDHTEAAVEQSDQSDQAKALPGLLKSSDIVTGWNGSMQSYSSDDNRRTAGKYCSGGRASAGCLQKAGLRWWIPPPYGTNSTGSIVDSCLVNDDPTSRVDVLVAIAKHISLDENDFPVLLNQLSVKASSSNECLLPISFQQWPNEKAANKEKGKRLLSDSDRIGFSASGLQELQILNQLHRVIQSPLGHPNLVLPVGLAIPQDENDTTQNREINDELYSKVKFEGNSQETYNMLFQSNTRADDVASKTTVPNNALLVLQPTPFALQRFLSKKSTTGRIDAVLSAWFHDVLSALVHCHTNGVLLCNAISADLIFVDPCGTIKFGGMFKWSALPAEGWLSLDPLKSAKAKVRAVKRKKIKDKDDFIPTDLYTAPEMLLGCPDHSKESDVWAVGCLLAHLLVQKPLFKGKDRADRILSIFKIAGAPQSKLFPSGKDYPRYVRPPKKYKGNVPFHLVKMLDDEEVQRYTKPIDLIANMIVLDPAKRWTAEKALASAYMVEHRANCSLAEYRKQFVSEWMSWKDQVMVEKNDQSRARDEERARKRMALATTTGGDDDLYDMADFISTSTSSSQSKKHKSSKVL